MRALQKFDKYDLPNEWDYCNLGNIALFNYGKPLSENQRIDGEFPVFGSNGIVGFHNEKLLDAPGIIVGRKGTSGKVNWSDEDYYPIDTTFYITTKTDSVDFKWLYFLMLLCDFEKFSITTGVPGLNRNDAHKLKIPKPPPPEQRAIASVLSKVDDAIAATKKTIAKAERLKKALMQNLLTGQLKPDGTRRSEDEFYIDEKFGKVPKGWEVKPIKSNQVCKINPTYEYQSGNTFPFVPMEAMNEQFKGIEYFNIRVVENSSGLTRFKNGDILFAKITPCTENGKATNVESLESDMGFASTEFIVFSPSENIDGLFLFYRMINDDIRNLMVSLMEGTTGRQRVPSNIFKRRVLISYPENKDEQIEIIQSLIKIDSSIKEKELKIQKLERLKKALMQNLLTGKKRLQADYIQGFSNG